MGCRLRGADRLPCFVAATFLGTRFQKARAIFHDGRPAYQPKPVAQGGDFGSCLAAGQHHTCPHLCQRVQRGLGASGRVPGSVGTDVAATVVPVEGLAGLRSKREERIAALKDSLVFSYRSLTRLLISQGLIDPLEGLRMVPARAS